MTREEALRKVKGYLTDYLPLEDADEIDEIMLALEQQTSEDVISRKALDEAISALTYWHFENDRLVTGGGGSKGETVYKVDDVTRLTHILPPVTPQLKTGHWNRVIDKAGHWVWECDNCDWQQRFYTNYCPDCGAKMKSEDEKWSQ